MVRGKIKAIFSRALFAAKRLESASDTSLVLGNPKLDCNILEDRVLLSASPLPIFADSDSIDTLDFDGNVDDTADFDRAFDSFNSALNDLVSATNGHGFSSAQLVIIDADVHDADLLVADLEGKSVGGESLWVEFLDANKDGVDQITELLERYDNLDSIHIVSHGAEGAVQLGSSRLDIGSLDGYAADIAGWANSLDWDADILIYGCDVAATDDGQLLIDTVSELAGADVAASADITGHNSIGGDWELEYVVGELESVVVFSETVQADWQGSLATYVVTQTADDTSVGTLRWAIDQANTNGGDDSIR